MQTVGSKQRLPFSVTALPSGAAGRSASAAGSGFRAELRRYDCATLQEWAFQPTRPFISLTLWAGTMRRQGAYRFGSKQLDMIDLGRLFLVPANTPLQLRFEPGVRETLSCSLDPAKLADLGEFDWSEDTLSATLDIRNPNARSALQRLVSELRSPGPATHIVTEAAILLAAVELHRHVAANRGLGSKSPGALAPWQVRKVKERIEEAPAATLTLRELGADCGVSPRHLMRSFKAATGVTVGDYITETRIRHAAVLLTSSSKPIKQIAHECGFQTTAGFSTAFKRVTGSTPGERRRLDV